MVRTTGQTVGPFSTRATSLKAIEERGGEVSEHGQGDGKANQRGPLEKNGPKARPVLRGRKVRTTGPKDPYYGDRCTPKCETVAKYLRHRWPYYGGKSPVLRDEINHRGTKIRRSMPHEPWNSERFMDFLISKGVNPNATA